MSAGQGTPPQSVPQLDVAGLQNLSGVVQTSMAAIQQLAAELDRVGNTNMSAADLIEIQYEMAEYTQAAQMLSATMKELQDTMKTVVQHIG